MLKGGNFVICGENSGGLGIICLRWGLKLCKINANARSGMLRCSVRKGRVA